MNVINTGISRGQRLTVMIVCSLLVVPAWSDEVTYADDSYSKGDTLTADDLNTKFNGIKAGVNDNHSRATANSTAIETNRTNISTNSVGVENNRTGIAKSNADINSLSDKVNARTTAAQPKAGDMQYWNGKAWVLVPAPSDTSVRSTLAFVKGKPVWKTDYYKIGDRGPAGGIVFYVTDDGAHGLEAAPVDQSRGVTWGCYGKRMSGRDDMAIGAGAQNTAKIMADCTEGLIAARAAEDYTFNGYDDWFLPSKDELNEMWLKLADSDGDGRNQGPDDPHNLGGFTVDNYWSSSDIGLDVAWVQAFFSGNQIGRIKNDHTDKRKKQRVRAIRAF